MDDVVNRWSKTYQITQGYTKCDRLAPLFTGKAKTLKKECHNILLENDNTNPSVG